MVSADAQLADLTERVARYPVERYPAQHATALFHLGSARLQRGEAAAALADLGRAGELFASLGMAAEQAKAALMRAIGLRESGRLEEAARAFAQTAAVFRELGMPAEWAAAAYNLGLVLQAGGQRGEALEAFTRARLLFEQAGLPARAAAAARELGVSLLHSGEATAAVSALRDAVSLADAGGDTPGRGAAGNALGLACLAAGDLPGAVAALTDAARIFPRALRPDEHAMVKANLALAYEQSGDHPRARLAARQVLAIPAAHPPVRRQAEEVLGRLTAAPRADLVTVWLGEPAGPARAVIGEEVARWLAVTGAERQRGVRDFAEGLLSVQERAYDLAEDLLAVWLELPPTPYRDLAAALVAATAARPAAEAERLQAVFASALARFALPQWQRLVAQLNATAAAAGEPATWR